MGRVISKPDHILQITSTAPRCEPEDAVVADFNGDGTPDLAVSDYDSNDVTVLVQTGCAPG